MSSDEKWTAEIRSALMTLDGMARTSYQQQALRTIKDALMVGSIVNDKGDGGDVRGDEDYLFNVFRLAYYGTNKSLAPELESFRRAYAAIAKKTPVRSVSDEDVEKMLAALNGNIRSVLLDVSNAIDSPRISFYGRQSSSSARQGVRSPHRLRTESRWRGEIVNCPEHLVFNKRGLWVWLYWHDVPREYIPLGVWLNLLRYEISYVRNGHRIFTINDEGRWYGRIQWLFLRTWRALFKDKP